jgi:hypothetical protein
LSSVTHEAELSKPLLQRIRNYISDEFQLCSQHAPHTFTWRHESLVSILLSAWVSFVTVAHIIYGTTLFSTIQFVLGGDAIVLIARYMASAIVCRAVLLYELHGLRSVTKLELAFP